ncbi:MAG: NAD(P)-binding domain-containing protein, partial [Sphingobacteriales bacterium]|nr:NAD(P)-binding domain-containing protein [Sphingobacteriales bacterium]
MQVVMIGSGNTATVISKLLFANGFQISQVVSRNIKHAQILANEFNCAASDFSSPMDETADIYLIAVSDKVIHEVVNYIPKNNKLILHTAGSVSKNV